MWAPETALAKTNDPAPAPSIEKWLQVEISGLLQGWGTRISQESYFFSCGFAAWEAALFRAPPISEHWCILLRALPWDPLSFEVVPPSLCGKEDRASRGPQAWARSACVVSKFFGSQGPRGSPKCSEKPCVGEDRRGSIGNRASSTHKRSPAVLTVSTIATEKTKTPGQETCFLSDPGFRGKEARNIFRAFKTMFCLFLQREKINYPEGFCKNQLSVLEMSGKTLTCCCHFLSVSRN